MERVAVADVRTLAFVDARVRVYDCEAMRGREEHRRGQRRIAGAMREEVTAFGDLNALTVAVDPEEAARSFPALGYLRGTSNATGRCLIRKTNR